MHIIVVFYCIIIIKKDVRILNKLKIPQNHSGLTKTLRLPEDMIDKIQSIANIKNLSFNKTVITLLNFSLDNLDEEDKNQL